MDILFSTISIIFYVIVLYYVITYIISIVEQVENNTYILCRNLRHQKYIEQEVLNLNKKHQLKNVETTENTENTENTEKEEEKKNNTESKNLLTNENMFLTEGFYKLISVVAE